MKKFNPSFYIIAGLFNRLSKYYMSRSFYSKLSLKFLAAAVASTTTPLLVLLLNIGLKHLNPQSSPTTCINPPIELTTLIVFIILIGLSVFFALKHNTQNNKSAKNEAIIFNKQTGEHFNIGMSSVQFYCGSVTQISGIDVVVTSEDTDLNLGSPSGTSVSGRIRKMAATTNELGELENDNLKKFIDNWKLGKNKFDNFKLGTTVECNNTYNATNNDIKTIILAVAIRKNGDKTCSIDESAINKIIDSSVDIALRNSHDSIFFPVFGLGSGRIPQSIAIPATVNAIKRKLTSTERSIKVYIGVYTFDDLAELCLQLSKS